MVRLFAIMFLLSTYCVPDTGDTAVMGVTKSTTPDGVRGPEDGRGADRCVLAPACLGGRALVRARAAATRAPPTRAGVKRAER